MKEEAEYTRRIIEHDDWHDNGNLGPAPFDSSCPICHEIRADCTSTQFQHFWERWIVSRCRGDTYTKYTYRLFCELEKGSPNPDNLLNLLVESIRYQTIRPSAPFRELIDKIQHYCTLVRTGQWAILYSDSHSEGTLSATTGNLSDTYCENPLRTATNSSDFTTEEEYSDATSTMSGSFVNANSPQQPAGHSPDLRKTIQYGEEVYQNEWAEALGQFQGEPITPQVRNLNDWQQQTSTGEKPDKGKGRADPLEMPTGSNTPIGTPSTYPPWSTLRVPEGSPYGRSMLQNNGSMFEEVEEEQNFSRPNTPPLAHSTPRDLHYNSEEFEEIMDGLNEELKMRNDLKNARRSIAQHLKRHRKIIRDQSPTPPESPSNDDEPNSDAGDEEDNAINQRRFQKPSNHDSDSEKGEQNLRSNYSGENRNSNSPNGSNSNGRQNGYNNRSSPPPQNIPPVQNSQNVGSSSNPLPQNTPPVQNSQNPRSHSTPPPQNPLPPVNQNQQHNTPSNNNGSSNNASTSQQNNNNRNVQFQLTGQNNNQLRQPGGSGSTSGGRANNNGGNGSRRNNNNGNNGNRGNGSNNNGRRNNNGNDDEPDMEAQLFQSLLTYLARPQESREYQLVDFPDS